MGMCRRPGRPAGHALAPALPNSLCLHHRHLPHPSPVHLLHSQGDHFREVSDPAVPLRNALWPLPGGAFRSPRLSTPRLSCSLVCRLSSLRFSAATPSAYFSKLTPTHFSDVTGENIYIYNRAVDQERGRVSRSLALKPAPPLCGFTSSELHNVSGLEFSHLHVLVVRGPLRELTMGGGF